MKMLSKITATLQFLSEGVSQIFSPRNDQYPNVGVQPFDGEPFSQWIELDRH